MASNQPNTTRGSQMSRVDPLQMSGPSQVCDARSVTINAPTQEFNDCFVYAIVKILVKLIGNIINEPVADIPEKDPNTMFARVSATFANRNGVEIVDFSKLPASLQSWGHLANVLQKYIRKYYSSDGGMTLNVLTEIIAKFNELSWRYNQEPDVTKKQQIIKDFLEFKNPVPSATSEKQQIISKYNIELFEYLTKSINKLNGIVRLIPSQYTNILRQIVSDLSQYHVLLGSIDQIRNPSTSMLQQTQENQVNVLTTRATTFQTNLDTMISDAIKLLTALNPEQTNLIFLLTQVKKTVTTLLPNIKQSQEIYGSVLVYETRNVLPIFENLFQELNLKRSQFEVNPRDVPLDEQDQEYITFTYALNQTGKLVKTDPKNQKILQLCKTLLLRNYAHLSIRASDKWFDLFSKVGVTLNFEKMPSHTRFPTICRSTDPNIFISNALVQGLIEAGQERAPNISGHAVVIKGIKIINDDIYLLIENSWGPTWPACWINIAVFGTFVESAQLYCPITSHYRINIVSKTRRDEPKAVDMNEIDIDLKEDEPTTSTLKKRARDDEDQASCANSCEERIITVWDLDNNLFRFESDLESKIKGLNWFTEIRINNIFKKYEAVDQSRSGSASGFGGSTIRMRPKRKLCATRRLIAHNQCRPNPNNNNRNKTAKTVKNRKNRKNTSRKTRIRKRV
jgi:hypothetical protein